MREGGSRGVRAHLEQHAGELLEGGGRGGADGGAGEPAHARGARDQHVASGLSISPAPLAPMPVPSVMTS